MRLRIPNRLEDVFSALHLAEETLRRARHVDEGCRADVRLVLEELLVNTVRHGYPDGRDGHIDIDLRILTQRVELELNDDGQAFDPGGHAPPDLPGDLADRDAGGLGLHLARSIADTFTYSRGPKGNRVILHFCPQAFDESP
ncbi:ATP-binding protein [Luteibacter sp. PPL201]|uniref:ATP-binding protein n=1 Tax=Luteibacter sahnii TaxID=3021977 RepID=A0ABT6B6N4_9GAMM|nr:ATP-binding protein [Luteibacter sp. PPL193]MDY1548298.1 ATP-binding protein [Luteibacter sp. PPL193]